MHPHVLKPPSPCVCLPSRRHLAKPDLAKSGTLKALLSTFTTSHPPLANLQGMGSGGDVDSYYSGAGALTTPSIPVLLRALEARLSIEEAGRPPCRGSCAPLGSLRSYEILLRYHNKQDQSAKSLGPTNVTTKQRLHGMTLELQRAHRYEAAEALDLVVAWLLRFEEEQERHPHSNGDKGSVFPSSSVLTVLSLLAGAPGLVEESAGIGARNLGPLATGLLTRSRQQTPESDAVLRPEHRSKQGHVPPGPSRRLEVARGGCRHLGETWARTRGEKALEPVLEHPALPTRVASDWNVMGERRLMDGDAHQEGTGLCGATLYPSWVFSTLPEPCPTLEMAPPTSALNMSEAERFLAKPWTDASFLSSLRPLRPAGARPALAVPDVGGRLTLPPLSDTRAQDPLDRVLRSRAWRQADTAPLPSAHGVEASRRPPPVASPSQDAPPPHPPLPATNPCIAPPPQPPCRPSLSPCLGWESTWATGGGPHWVPPSPRLLSQEPSPALDAVLPPSRPGPVLEQHMLVDAVFQALRGLPSQAFLLDTQGLSLQPRPYLRVVGSSTGSIQRALDGVAVAGTCFLRLQTLSAYLGSQCLLTTTGSGGRAGWKVGGRAVSQVYQAFAAVLGRELACWAARVEEEREYAGIRWAEKGHSPGNQRQASVLEVWVATKSLRSWVQSLAGLCHCFPPPSSPPQAGPRVGPCPWSPPLSLQSLPQTGAGLLATLYRWTLRAQACGPHLPSLPPSLPPSPPPSCRQSPSLVRADCAALTAENSVFLTLLEAAAAPYLLLVQKWVFQGHVTRHDDPCHEFPLRIRETREAAREGGMGRKWYGDDASGSDFLRLAFEEAGEEDGEGREGGGFRSRVPPFLQEDLFRRVVMAGKLLYMLSRAHDGYYQKCAKEWPPVLRLVEEEREEEEEEEEKKEKKEREELEEEEKEEEKEEEEEEVGQGEGGKEWDEERPGVQVGGKVEGAVRRESVGALVVSVEDKEWKVKEGEEAVQGRDEGGEEGKGGVSWVELAKRRAGPEGEGEGDGREGVRGERRAEEEKGGMLADGIEAQERPDALSESVGKKATTSLPALENWTEETGEVGKEGGKGGGKERGELETTGWELGCGWRGGMDPTAQGAEGVSEEGRKEVKGGVDEGREEEGRGREGGREEDGGARMLYWGWEGGELDGMGPWGRSGKRRKGKVSGRRLDLMKLEAVLSHQCDSVERTAVAFFLDEGAFLGHIRGLRRLLLGAGCALTSEFVSLLQTRQQEEAALEGPRPADVWPAFEAAVSALGLESDAYLRCFSYRLRRRVDVRAGQRSRGMATGEQGDGEYGSSCTDGEGGEGLGALEDLDADYLPPWPLGTVLPQTTIQTYVRVHELLLRVHWSLQRVQRTRESVRVALKHMGRGEEAKGKRSAPRPSGEQGSVRKEEGVFALRCAHVLLYRLSLVASAFLEHMAAVVDGLGWRALEGALARGVPPPPSSLPDAVASPHESLGGTRVEGDGEGGRQAEATHGLTVERLREMHAAYIRDVATRCFVDPDGGVKVEGDREGGKAGGEDAEAPLPSLQAEVTSLMTSMGHACSQVEGHVFRLVWHRDSRELGARGRRHAGSMGEGREGEAPAGREAQDVLRAVAHAQHRLRHRLSRLADRLRGQGREDVRRSFEREVGGSGRRGSEFCGYLADRLEDISRAGGG